MISKQQLEDDLARKSPGWWSNTQSMIGRENCYIDKVCGFYIVTIDRHAGVTPMFLACRNPEGCTGKMHSMGYPPIQAKPAWLGEPTHEWYRPESVDDDALDDAEADHVMNGGLLLREINAD